ncbi:MULTISPECIES: DJ-1/PfpI family protein [unclassified Moraxella]|uniref:DJ-1/PfpI family protein n=1 Tax=unclassified Moraxella TaxID=2685852 RepID=UPI003AF9CFD2
MQHITALLFDDFETLDLFGVVEVFGRLPEIYTCHFVSLTGGLITSSQNVQIQTVAVADFHLPTDIFLIIGGKGTRQLVNDSVFLQQVKDFANQATFVLSVCTGSALLAKAGLLDDKSATSNKLAWQWVIAQSDKVNWIGKARWVVDGKFYTSAGVSAGMDMAYGFLADQHGIELARQKAHEIEYHWQEDPNDDSFFTG